MGRRATAVKTKAVVKKKKRTPAPPPVPPVPAVPPATHELTSTLHYAFREYAAKVFGQQHLHTLLVSFGITGMQWAAMSKVKRSGLIMLYFVNVRNDTRALSRKEQANMARITRKEIATHSKAKKRELYQTFRDRHGLCYLRVDVLEDGQQFVVQLGKVVDLVTLDEVSLKTRELELLPQLPPRMTAQRLANPGASATVSPAAKQHLEHILKTKEFQVNIPAKPSKKKSVKKSTADTSAKSAAPAKKAAKKSAVKKERVPRKGTLITLKKTPKEGLAPQAQVFIDALKKLGGKNVPTAKLVGAVESGKKLETRQPVGAVWNHYRRGFIEDGVIGITTAE